MSTLIGQIAKYDAKYTGANVTEILTQLKGHMDQQQASFQPILERLDWKIKAAVNTLGFLNSEVSSALAFGKAMWSKMQHLSGDTLINELAACMDGKWAAMSTLTPADYRDECLTVFNVIVP